MKSKLEMMRHHNQALNMWLSKEGMHLWCKLKGCNEYFLVDGVEHLCKVIEPKCDLVCSPVQPQMVQVGNIWCIAPITNFSLYTVKSKVVAYTPKINEDGIYSKHDLYESVVVTYDNFIHTDETLPLFLRTKDAIKYGKALSKLKKRLQK